MNPRIPANCRLYGILDLSYTPRERIVPTTQLMLEGGVDILQLRAKGSTPADIVTMAREVAPLCRAAKIPFVINDHPGLTIDSSADGAHVGQDDTPVADARLLAGEGSIVGKSTHSVDQAVKATEEAPDYIGFGPLFATPTKPDYRPIGIEDIAEVHRRVKLPIFCIGGIKLENLDQVVAAGARRVVIVSGILQAPDIAAYCRNAKKLLAATPIA